MGTMPLYFAYGANLDRVGMADRCPGATTLGLACLDDHRFFIMRDGYASVIPQPGAMVHGLLWDVTPTDLAALDDYEDVSQGLYRRTMRPVMRDGCRHDAAIYLGTSTTAGVSRPGYMESVLAAADACALPAAYRAELRRWLVRA